MILKRHGIRALAAALLALIAITAACLPALAVTREQIDALREESRELRGQKTELQAEINAISSHLRGVLDEKARLDGEIEAIAGEVEALDAQIRDYEARIAEKEAELEHARNQEEDQTLLFRERVRSMEEQGRRGYLTVLFRANSVSDLLSRLDFVGEIMEADQRVIDDLKTLQIAIAEKEAELEREKASVEAARAERVEKQEELNEERERANALIIELRADKSEAEDSLGELAAEEEAIQAEIQRLSRKLAQEEEAARQAAIEAARRQAAEAEARRAAEAARQREAQAKAARAESAESELWYRELDTPAASGGYAWPVSSHKVTSTFGGRSSPGGIGSTNHKGIDIGGVGYSTSVHAAKSGKVIVSQYSSSYGNYVVISHGSGNTTLYGHMSKRLVSVGQSVGKGDVIGITGSTGCSTGPHLHFEISENGVRVNPLHYF